VDFIFPMMSTLSEHFRATVEAFLAKSGFKPTEFGRQAVGDPSFVLGLRRGRSPTLATADKVMTFIREIETTVPQTARNRKNDD
jgi:hypothetical protein